VRITIRDRFVATLPPEVHRYLDDHFTPGLGYV
jgi:hypothetical protein